MVILKAKDLYDITNPTREQVFKTLFRPPGWEEFWYSGLALLDFGISEDNVVLDVGGGDRPFPRANVVVEKFVFDSSQRHNREVVRSANQILVCAAAEEMPFEDNSFDFVYTSHTLEHIDNLPAAIEEISRVGKRGYVAVPRGCISPMVDRDDCHHLWMCRYEYHTSTLLIRRKRKWEYMDELARYPQFLHVKCARLTHTDHSYPELYEHINRNVMEIRFVWKDKIKYLVVED
jgi:ubiquinone/menaquinone biosynthesis C-methylase UbiE